MIRAIGIGDCVCDKYLHLGKMFPGGQALNFAVQCSMAGCEAAFVGVGGSDHVASHIRAVLTELGVDISRTRNVEGENGYAVVDLKDGERVFVFSNKGGVLREQPLSLSADDLDYISSFDIAHTSNNGYTDKQLSRLRALDIFLSYDFSLSWADTERMHGVCGNIDAGFFSCAGCTNDEARALLRRASKQGCSLAVATLGERGALAFDGTNFYEYRPAPLEPVDTLGAGDAFAAGFLMAYIARREESGQAAAVQSALVRGAALSAKTCMTYGAFGYGVDIEETV